MSQVMKKCPVCGTKFEAIGRRRFDTDECKFVAFRRRQKAKAAPEQRPCVQCGTLFPVTRTNKTHCKPACAKRSDNLRQRAIRNREAAAQEVLRQKAAGKLQDAEFKAAAQALIDGAPEPSRRSTKNSEPSALDQIKQALYDAKATARAQIVRREPPGFDPQEAFADDPAFLRREAAITEHLASKAGGSGQGPSIAVMRMIRDREVDNG